MLSATSPPPASAAIKRSSVIPPYNEKIFINIEDTTITYIVVSRNLIPNFQILISNNGIFIINTNVPISTPVSLFRIMAVPETPPGTRLLASRNKLTPTAYIIAATVILIYFIILTTFQRN